MDSTKIDSFERKHPQALVIDSEVFRATNYILVDDHIVIDGGAAGRLNIHKSCLDELLQELIGISDTVANFTAKEKAPSTIGVVKSA